MQTPHNDTPHPNVFHQTKVYPACNPHESDTEEYFYFIDFKSISLTASPPHPDTRPHSIIYSTSYSDPLPLLFPYLTLFLSIFPSLTLPLPALPTPAAPTSQPPLCRSEQTPHCLTPSVPRGTLRLSPNTIFATEIHTPLFIFNRAIFYFHSSIPIHSYTSLIDTDTSLFPTLSHIFAYPSCFAPSTSTTSSPAITRTHPVLHNEPTLTFPDSFASAPTLVCSTWNKTKAARIRTAQLQKTYIRNHIGRFTTPPASRDAAHRSRKTRSPSPLPYRPKQTNRTLMSAGETPGMREA